MTDVKNDENPRSPLLPVLKERPRRKNGWKVCRTRSKALAQGVALATRASDEDEDAPHSQSAGARKYTRRAIHWSGGLQCFWARKENDPCSGSIRKEKTLE
eukprot:293089-Amphidinium_carterae.1